MLQYSAVSGPLDHQDYFRHNDRLTSMRVQKDSFVARPPFTPLPQSATNINSSPTLSSPSTTCSSKLPRSPYISSRQLSGPIPLSEPRIKSSVPSRPSSVASEIDDVLFPGDVVNQGGLLQGEPIRLVSIGSNALPEHEEPAKEFEVVRRLGAGSYAVVYLVREVLYRPPLSDDGHITVGHMDMDDKFCRRPTTVYGREYAIKCLSKANLNEEALAAQMSEVTIHQSLRSHPNIVTLHRTLETSSFLLLLLEYVPGEDLFYFLEQARDHYDSESSSESSHTPPTPSLLSNLHPSQLLSRTRLRLISSMFSQMCDAVAACHAQQVFHRDIKPENFIVTDGWVTLPDGQSERKVVVKLTDFGLSTSDVESLDMDCGSAPYMSYECRNNIAPTYRPRPADVWSLGIVLINMLYHFNPWTDTAQGACNSFDAYRQYPVGFFMQRFAGMTRPVAQFLAERVFNILDPSDEDGQRISARDFGKWIKDLPELLGQAPISANGSHHKRVTSVSSTTGHSISSSVPPSHRPSSRQATPVIQPRQLAGLPVSRAPSLGPALAPLHGTYGSHHDQDLMEEPEDELDQDDYEMQNEGMTSRSTSTNKRRKRGARKGKGMAVTPTTPKDETLDTLAVASQSLAREISKASRASSRQGDSIRSGKTTASHSTRSSSKRGQPYEPPSMYALPEALLAPAARQQSAVPPVPPIPQTEIVTPASVPVRPPVTKKPSKWKLSFGKTSAASLISTSSPVEGPSSLSVATSTADIAQTNMSATASNVTSLIMGLNAPAPHSAPATTTGPPPIPDEPLPSSTWNRGRRARRSPNPTLESLSSSQSHDDLRAPSVARLTSASLTSLNSSSSRPYPEERGRWGSALQPPIDPRSERAISPNSIRSRHAHLASSTSSISSGSNNWRNSMSTTSSAGTSTSAFTHYSNSSLRSVSTAATSVSSNSWRTGSVAKSSNSPTSPTSPGYSHPPGVPRNIKIMDGVPWELHELPRDQHPNPVGDIFGKPPVRKHRTRKPKDIKLDTINERPLVSAGFGKKSPEFPRQDAATSTTDLGGLSSRGSFGSDDGEWPNKKVQRGQINALAKMLSALRR
ncbi:hypothetical protein C8J56DRAFT_448170 [Mycena floridula]|nr:hypothetical protein C8J56DRAFT_448170 [Mycena floridula]